MTTTKTLGEACKLTPIIVKIRRHIQAARDYPQDIDITACDVEGWADQIEEAALEDMINASTVCMQTLFDPVLEMREAQKEYFKTRSADALRRAKHLERKVDMLLARFQAEDANEQEELPL